MNDWVIIINSTRWSQKCPQNLDEMFHFLSVPTFEKLRSDMKSGFIHLLYNLNWLICSIPWLINTILFPCAYEIVG